MHMTITLEKPRISEKRLYLLINAINGLKITCTELPMLV